MVRAGDRRTGCCASGPVPEVPRQTGASSDDVASLAVRPSVPSRLRRESRQYLQRGIAARQFQRAFLLADGMEVLGADLSNGLLSIDLARPEPERIVRKIDIAQRDDV